MANKIVQGLILPESSAAKYIMDYNKNAQGRNVYRDALISAQNAGQQAMSAQNINYSSAMNEAYAASLANNSAILGSNLSTGAKQLLLERQRSSLYDAYDAQQANLSQALGKIQTSVAETESSIYSDLYKQASTASTVFDEALNYLYALQDGQYSTQIDRLYSDMTYIHQASANIGTLGEDFNKDEFFKLMSEKNPGRLLTRDELSSYLTEQNPDTGEITLNQRGIDFMDRVLNSASNLQSGELSFGSYLAENNPDLYNWLQEYNVSGTTNQSMFKSMVGLDKNDNEYSFQERAGGYTEQELNTLIKPMTDAISNINIKDGQTVKQNKKDIAAMQASVTSLEEMAQKFGVYDEYKKQIDELKNFMETELKRDTGWTTYWNNFGKEIKANWSFGKIENPSVENRSESGDKTKEIRDLYLQIANQMLKTAVQKRQSKELQFNSQY